MVGRRPLHLRPSELKVLAFLLENSGRVVTFEEITSRALQREESVGLVRNQIWEIRQKLDEVGYPDLIATVRGRGYWVAMHAAATRRAIGKA